MTDYHKVSPTYVPLNYMQITYFSLSLQKKWIPPLFTSQISYCFYNFSLDLGVVKIIIISSIGHGIPENSKAIIHALLKLVNQASEKQQKPII